MNPYEVFVMFKEVPAKGLLEAQILPHRAILRRSKKLRLKETTSKPGQIDLRNSPHARRYRLNSSRSRFVCARLTGISVCCLSFMRS